MISAAGAAEPDTFPSSVRPNPARYFCKPPLDFGAFFPTRLDDIMTPLCLSARAQAIAVVVAVVVVVVVAVSAIVVERGKRFQVVAVEGRRVCVREASSRWEGWASIWTLTGVTLLKKVAAPPRS